MLGFLRRLFGQGEPSDKLSLSVLQIEVTTRCQLKCTFCPNHSLGSKWISGDFPWELYRDSVAPYFPHVDWAHLQGWGEPLLHPHFWDMFRLAREGAQRVGFTTNGMLLNEENARRFVEGGGDLVDVSFSGNTQQTHESLRRGSKLQRVKENVRRLADLKKEAGSDTPVIVLSYMLTKPSIAEFPDFIDTAAEIGANEVVAINLDYTPAATQDDLRVFNCGSEPNPEYESMVQDAEKRAQKRGLVFRRYPLYKDESVLVCDARPLDTVFINSRGEMTPCTYLGMSVGGQIPRLYCGEPHHVDPVSYGNVVDGLAKVWNGDTARAFKSPFARRHALSSPAALLLMGGDETPEVPSPPPQCEHCHKLYKI